MPRKRQCKGLKRKYDAAFKEEVLNSLRTTCGGNVGKAARLHDVPEQTLCDWRNRDGPMVIGSGCTTQLPHWVERDLCDAVFFKHHLMCYNSILCDCIVLLYNVIT